MTGMDKMWASFIAMGFMVLAMLLVTFARTKTKGALRVVLSIVAFLMLLFGVPYMLASMM